jgi:hypothetical protein
MQGCWRLMRWGGGISDGLFLFSAAFTQDNLLYESLVHEWCNMVLSILGARRGAGGVGSCLGSRIWATDEIVLEYNF